MYSRTWMRTYSGCTSSMSVSFYHLAFWWCGRWWQQKRRRRWRENDDDGSGDGDGDGDDSNIGQRGRAPPSNSVGYRESIFSQHNTFIQAINIRNCCHLERYSDSRNMHNWVEWASNLNRDIIHAEYVLCVRLSFCVQLKREKQAPNA